MRVTTTVMESNIHYPTNLEILKDGVKVITRVVKKISVVSQGLVGKIRDRSRSARKKVFQIVTYLAP